MRPIYIILLGIVIELVCIAGLYGYVYFDIKRVDARIQDVTRQAQLLGDWTKDAEEIYRNEENLRERLSLITNVNANKLWPLYAFEAISSSIPEEAWLTEVDQKNSRMVIVGYAITNQSISSFMTNLSASGRFPNVDLVFSSLEKVDDVQVYRFKIECTVSEIL